MSSARLMVLAPPAGIFVRPITVDSGTHESFAKALAEGKEIADSKIEKSLYNSAMGYFVDEEERLMPLIASDHAQSS